MGNVLRHNIQGIELFQRVAPLIIVYTRKDIPTEKLGRRTLRIKGWVKLSRYKLSQVCNEAINTRNIITSFID